MTSWDSHVQQLIRAPKTWLITGVAGFIGSNLAEFLLKTSQRVIGIDNLSTGKLENVNLLKSLAGAENKSEFSFFEGDINDYRLCFENIKKADYILHQAALGSVPRSLKDPLASNYANISGTLSILQACREAGAKKLVFASSSSVYGDSDKLPKKEGEEGCPLSPYAITKAVNELYATNFSRMFEMSIVGLRYFNVFGRRQDPAGPYAAVIPRWIKALINEQECEIYGDGETSRDFCYIDNVIQANILAAVTELEPKKFYPLNIACGDNTSLNKLHSILAEAVKNSFKVEILPPKYLDFRSGDVRHSLADISDAKSLISYLPVVDVATGIIETVNAYTA
ncbi:MAG: NAD-dependent epimerase/dehydratase family protein [Bdellovibrionales bacterium]|nr:NAD-dependent epimerase/dehydratase family protein [Bdellovibrionales bacterium]